MHSTQARRGFGFHRYFPLISFLLGIVSLYAGQLVEMGSNTWGDAGGRTQSRLVWPGA